MLAQVPYISLISRQAGTMDTALLSGTNTDGLPLLYITNRIRLSILQCNKCYHQITLGGFGKILIPGRDICKQLLPIQLNLITTLLKSNSENIFMLNRSRFISRINLDYIISTLTLILQYLKRLIGISRRNYSVRHFTIYKTGSSLITHIT